MKGIVALMGIPGAGKSSICALLSGTQVGESLGGEPPPPLPAQNYQVHVISYDNIMEESM
jgi:hypothetical protein